MIRVPSRHDRVFTCEPAKTALLVIDMQRDWVSPEGAAARAGEDVRPLLSIVPLLKRVVTAAREKRMPVIHTREGHLPDLSDLPPAKKARSATAGAEIGAPGPLGRILIRGEHGHDFIDDLRPVEGEPVFDKPGLGAFYCTGLQAYLTRLGAESVIVAGVTTQGCVQSTLREAVDRGYRCLTLEDCCAAFSQKWHEATLDMIASEGHLLGWVSSGGTLIDALRGP